MGSNLWNQLTHVVILKQQMRVQDPRYQELLDRVADGESTEEDFALLCTRIISSTQDFRLPKFSLAPMIVPGNKLVAALNITHARSEAKRSRYQLLLSAAVDKEHGILVSDSMKSKLHHLPTTKTGNLVSHLPLFPGMPVKICENIAVELGLANSTSGTIKDVILHPDEQHNEQQNRTDEHILQHHPHCVIIAVETTTCPKLQDLDIKHIPIYPTSATFRFKLPHMKFFRSLTRYQVSLVPEYAYTAHKSQAQTLRAIVVDLVKPSNMRRIDTSFAYVPLSRIRKLEDLLILRPFNISVLQKKKPKDLVKQDKKFALMSK